MKTRFSKMRDFYDQPMSQHLKRPCIRNSWLKLLTMYSYSALNSSTSFRHWRFPRDYVFVNWVRIKGGVYSILKKNPERFKGEIANVEIAAISSPDAVKKCSDSNIQEFDKVVFATH